MSTGKIVGLINAMGGSPSGGGGTTNAVQFVQQTLTEEQQMQARKNLNLPYTLKESVVILPETELSFSEMNGVYLAQVTGLYPILNVDAITVIWNGETYECAMGKYGFGNASLNGRYPEEDTGEPFLIFGSGTDLYVIATNAERVMASITSEIVLINKLSDAYIPEKIEEDMQALRDFVNEAGDVYGLVKVTIGETTVEAFAQAIAKYANKKPIEIEVYDSNGSLYDCVSDSSDFSSVITGNSSYSIETVQLTAIRRSKHQVMLWRINFDFSDGIVSGVSLVYPDKLYLRGPNSTVYGISIDSSGALVAAQVTE